MTVTGKDLIELGFPEGRELGAALVHVNAEGLHGVQLARWVEANRPAPRIGLQEQPGYVLNIDAETALEAENVDRVKATMDVMMRTPTLRRGAVMPDACPAGPEGTIPVGGVAVAQNAIHPGMHSADICCSVMVTEFADSVPGDVMNVVHKVTHFGPGGRADGQHFTLSPGLYEAFRANRFLRDPKILQAARAHLGTQGDGNHFAYVGRSSANGTTCLVTHHGSRGPGAGLYRLGMRAAETWRRKLSEGVLTQNAWIPADSDEGIAYWEALQLIRQWTKANHDAIHQATAEMIGAGVRDRFWNEHNFVFRKGDLFYHAKGATPIDAGMLPDSAGIQILPLNMAEPVLLIRGEANDRNMGFAPPGAGRNMSRSAHRRMNAGQSEEEIFAGETTGLDVRFYSGAIDVSELPSAYKNAASVRDQMKRFGLADVVDEIVPYGSIMAGDWQRNAPWKLKARAKHAASAAREAGKGAS
ncbi:MAG: RtcB family protein [Pseudomonadota bacterium]